MEDRNFLRDLHLHFPYLEISKKLGFLCLRKFPFLRFENLGNTHRGCRAGISDFRLLYGRPIFQNGNKDLCDLGLELALAVCESAALPSGACLCCANPSMHLSSSDPGTLQSRGNSNCGGLPRFSRDFCMPTGFVHILKSRDGRILTVESGENRKMRTRYCLCHGYLESWYGDLIPPQPVF